MGISNMQGTSAFLEYIGERKVKKTVAKIAETILTEFVKQRKLL